MQLTLWYGLACCALPLGLAQGPLLEIEFEPLGAFDSMADDRAPPDMLQDLLSGMTKAGASGGSSPSAHREGELDRAMAAFLGGKQPAGGGPKTTRWSSPDGSQQVVIEQEVVPSSAQRSRLPAGLFRDLFPGPLLMEEDGADPFRGLPFGGPDPLILDMLQGMGRSFHQDMLPALHRSTGGARAPRSCQADLGKHCGKERSQVHCLGQHQDDISEACRQDVGKSVPFLCSQAIDKYCDVLQTGILTCLGEHLQDLDSQCSDAVIATRHVISKVNSQKTSIKVNGQTTQPPLPAVLGSLGLSADGSTAQLGKQPSERADQNINLLETTSDLVAEALKHHPAKRQQQLISWRVLLCGLLLAVAAYAWMFTDGTKRVYSAFKPYMHVDEDSKPLRSGVELPKPLAI